MKYTGESAVSLSAMTPSLVSGDEAARRRTPPAMAMAARAVCMLERSILLFGPGRGCITTTPWVAVVTAAACVVIMSFFRFQ